MDFNKILPTTVYWIKQIYCIWFLNPKLSTVRKTEGMSVWLTQHKDQTSELITCISPHTLWMWLSCVTECIGKVECLSKIGCVCCSLHNAESRCYFPLTWCYHYIYFKPPDNCFQCMPKTNNIFILGTSSFRVLDRGNTISRSRGWWLHGIIQGTFDSVNWKAWRFVKLSFYWCLQIKKQIE